jgi:hypothetical protein
LVTTEYYKQAAAIHSGSHLVWWRGGAIGAGGSAGAVHDDDDEADSGDEASNANASSSSSSSSSSTANPGGADDSSRFTLDRYDARNLIESAVALRKFRRFAQQHRAIDESGAVRKYQRQNSDRASDVFSTFQNWELYYLKAYISSLIIFCRWPHRHFRPGPQRGGFGATGRGALRRPV